jgi:hypothetical protein
MTMPDRIYFDKPTYKVQLIIVGLSQSRGKQCR